MAFGSTIFYGYKVSNNLSDVIDRDLALERLTLNIGDLDIIRGADEAGVVRQDVIALSGLNVNAYKELDRLLGETDRYSGIMENSAGTDASLQGNLDVNGAVAASGIRYKYLDSGVIKLADISTSRVSAWSTTSSTPAESDPIFYGNQVKIKSGGIVSVDKLTWGEVAQPKLFLAELPTHKITTTINGEVIELYAMKSIPLKFDGYFRNFDGLVNVDVISGIPVGWRIFDLTNSADIQTYTGTSLNYRSVKAAPRRIELYYPPDKFNTISLPGIGVSELPQAQLSGLTNLNISFNQFKTMPDLVMFSPTLENLTIHRNNLYLSENASLRKLNSDVVNRLPDTITSLNMYGTYFGSIRCVNRSDPYNTNGDVDVEITSGIGGSGSMSVIEARFTSLITLNIGRGSGAYFNPDEYDSAAYLPTVSNTCQNYYAAYNDFRTVPDVGVKDLSNLRNFDVYGNYYLTDASFSLSSQNLINVNIGSTALSIPNLSSRSQLTNFNASYNRSTTSLFTGATDESYKFANCTSLQSLSFYAASVSGYIPKFIGNNNLSSVDFYAAQNLTGGRPSGTEYVMYKDTFQDAKGIRFFRVLSTNLLVGKGFEPETFKNLPNLYYLYWYSYRRTGSGATVTLPDISSCPALQYMIMPVNDFSGSVPSFAANNQIYYVDLSNNKLSGPVPSFSNKTRMRYLFLYNNQLTSFPGFDNTGSMDYVYLQNNLIAGSIPSMSGAVNVSRLYIQNNQLSSYTVGSLASLRRLQTFDVSNNQLSASDLNNIIDDLYTNYQSSPRPRVTINLRSQSRAVGYNPSSDGTPREQEVREKIDFLVSRGWSIAFGG